MAWHRTGDKPLPEPMLIQLTNTYMRHSRENQYILGEIGQQPADALAPWVARTSAATALPMQDKKVLFFLFV